MGVDSNARRDIEVIEKKVVELSVMICELRADFMVYKQLIDNYLMQSNPDGFKRKGLNNDN